MKDTRGGIWTLRKYRSKGKRTIYDPGLFTSHIGLLELGIYQECDIWQ